MGSLNYYLDRGTVTLWYTFPGKKFRFSLKEKIADPGRNWDHKKQRVKTYLAGYDKINLLLDTLERFVHDARVQAKIEGVYFGPDYLRKILTDRLAGKKNTFYDYAGLWLNDKPNITASTRQTYKICIDKINSVLPGLQFSEVDRFTQNKLYNYMNNAGYKPNYINRVFKVWRTIINAAYIDGLHENKYHLNRGFVPSPVEVDNIYLTLDDLNKLFDFWKTGAAADYLINSVNIFLRGCYTGQRWQTFSKFSSIMVFNSGGVDMINIKQVKTSVNVSIPVSNRLRDLLKTEVRSISRQKLSDYIKEAARIVKLNNWEKIGTHTARRTFATNMVLAGVDIVKIMSITGHRTEKEFRKYVKIDTIINARNTAADINDIFG